MSNLEREIARCEAEIHFLESRPDDVQEMAHLVALGIEDWKAEKRLLESEATATHEIRDLPPARV